MKGHSDVLGYGCEQALKPTKCKLNSKHKAGWWVGGTNSQEGLTSEEQHYVLVLLSSFS